MFEADNFENEVRRIARLRWPSAEFGGAEMIAGQERDGIFITEDCVHLVECTTSKTVDKARKDIPKLYALFKTLLPKYRDRAIKCWFITLNEPTADQREVRNELKGAPQNLFNIISYEQFRSKLIDAHDYLNCRETHRFGSISSPSSAAVGDVKYIDVPVKIADWEKPGTVDSISDSLIAGNRFCVLGEFGVGKSMMLREVFRYISKKYHARETLLFPIHLNLREHQGQRDPAEILERHARTIGFSNPSQLVRAWKAGFVAMILDGFDEVSSVGLQGAWRRLRDARRASTAGVRAIIEATPPTCGIIVAGRDNFFDTAQERRESLNQKFGWAEVRVDEFGEDQISALAKNAGFTGEIPLWVPARPLLISTLLGSGMLADAYKKLTDIADPAEGWEILLDEVCNREARIEHGISGEHIRGILEAIATLAREKDGGLGPILPVEIVKIFQDECGFEPTDEALIVLQRLPGLGSAPVSGAEARTFVDEDFADALRAGDFARFCEQPFRYGDSDFSQISTPIGSVGIGVASLKLKLVGFSEGNLTAAIKSLERHQKRGALPADLVNLSLRNGDRIAHLLPVSDVVLRSIDLVAERTDLGNVSFSGCFIDYLDIPAGVMPESCPSFRECLIQELEGRVSEGDLPRDRFSGCVIESYSASAETTDGAMALNLPAGVKVLLILLKKLFVQSVSGRKESALYRGLDGKHQVKVQPVLELLTKTHVIESITRHGEPIWIPVRRSRNRVMAILNAPTSSDDALMVEARRI